MTGSDGNSPAGGRAAPLPEPLPIAGHAMATLSIAGYPDFIATEGSTAWVTNEGRVQKLSFDHLDPVATVPLPSPCGVMVVAFGTLWVANCQDASVYRIDLSTAAITAIIPTGLADPTGELSLAAGAGSIWVLTDPSGALSRIDPHANRVIATIQVAPLSFAAAFGFGSVWITNTGESGAQTAGSVERIDPQTNSVIATIPLGPAPRFLAAGEGAVWTLNQGDGTVTRIDPQTNKVAATIAVGLPGPGGDIATGAGRIWVRAANVLLSVIDPLTNRVITRFGPPAGSGGVRVGDGIVWVTAHDTNTVWALHP